MESRKITNVILQGDSLMDRGAIYKRKLFGIIPMRWLAGLQGKTGGDSFTNGFTWSDYFIAALASQFTIKRLQKARHFDSTDISDAIVSRDVHVKSIISNYYNLKNHASVDFLGKNFIQDYTEGGLTAHDYSWVPSISISRFFSRLILTTLAAKRRELLNYNRKNNISADEKAKTLIIEWSGANDLITVNAKPSRVEVDKAIRARVNNVIELMNNGYYNFVLFNQPDLALTPRFQAKSRREIAEATRWCNYFNKRLEIACASLRKNNPRCLIEVYDVNAEFRDLYNNPEKYSLERDKLKIPFTDSEDFAIRADGTSPATGYMFWDDVHPTADAHARLGDQFFRKFKYIFKFIEPASARQIVYKDDLGMSYTRNKAPAPTKPVEPCPLYTFFFGRKNTSQPRYGFTIGQRDKGKEKEYVNDPEFLPDEEEDMSEEKSRFRY